MGKRIDELDFAKGVLIVLMVMFHLSWFGDLYPEAKRFVYAFHMPGFLLVSGFLLNVNKSPVAFLRSQWWVFVPYAVMETGYVLMCAVLPVRDAVDGLTPALWLDKLLLHPLGPYWYLHTLMLCAAVCYVGAGIGRRAAGEVGGAVLTIVLLLVPVCFGWVGGANALYFMTGVALRYVGSRTLIRRLPVGVWTVFPVVVLLIWHPSGLSKETPAGIVLTVSVMLSLFWCSRVLPATVRRPLLFVGRHTLPVLLFSPLFTLAARWVLPLFRFDPTALVPMVVSTLAAVAGSLFIAWCMDRAGLSRLFFGHSPVISR